MLEIEQKLSPKDLKKIRKPLENFQKTLETLSIKHI